MTTERARWLTSHIVAAAIAFVCLSAQSSAQPEKADKKIPHQEDETSLIRIKANAEIALGKEVVICGGIEIDDYYNYSYDNAEGTHYSLRFTEAGETYGDTRGENAHLYFLKKAGMEAVDVITKSAEKNKGSRVLKLARLKVMLHPGRYPSDKQWDMFEVTDIQFYDSTMNKWLPWMVETARDAAKKENAKKDAEERARREEAAKARAETAKANAKPPKDDDEVAASKLKLAKSLLEKNESAGKKRLQEIVEKYPTTEAGKEAAKLLKK